MKYCKNIKYYKNETTYLKYIFKTERLGKEDMFYELLANFTNIRDGMSDGMLEYSSCSQFIGKLDTTRQLFTLSFYCIEFPSPSYTYFSPWSLETLGKSTRPHKHIYNKSHTCKYKNKHNIPYRSAVSLLLSKEQQIPSNVWTKSPD